MLNEVQKTIRVRRLVRGQDLRRELAVMAAECELGAGVIISLVGSLTEARLRMAGGHKVRHFEGPLEIVSATGTIYKEGMHMHTAVSDSSGTTFGGHLMEGCIVKTTVEIVLQDLSDSWQFSRAHDAATGFSELVAVQL
jgi:predicted DNA-binding protein with PD1-like motif